MLHPLQSAKVRVKHFNLLFLCGSWWVLWLMLPFFYWHTWGEHCFESSLIVLLSSSFLTLPPVAKMFQFESIAKKRAGKNKFTFLLKFPLTFSFDTKSRSAFFWTKSVIQSSSTEELVLEDGGAEEERAASPSCSRAAASCFLFSSWSVSQLRAPQMRLRDLP